MLAACWSFMGIVGGMICLVSIFYFIFRQLTCALQHESRAAVTVGALACGWLVQLPLAGLTSGEIGVLFWTSVTLAMSFGRMAG
jgi:hypothetical protein